MIRYLFCLYCIVLTLCCFLNSRINKLKEMVILNLFIDYHYKSIVSIIRERHVLTLHLSTAN